MPVCNTPDRAVDNVSISCARRYLTPGGSVLSDLLERGVHSCGEEKVRGVSGDLQQMSHSSPHDL